MTAGTPKFPPHSRQPSGSPRTWILGAQVSIIFLVVLAKCILPNISRFGFKAKATFTFVPTPNLSIVMASEKRVAAWAAIMNDPRRRKLQATVRCKPETLPNFSRVRGRAREANIAVWNKDCLDVVLDLAVMFSKVCVLNLGNNLGPAGNAPPFHATQEEVLLQRTDLGKSLLVQHYPLETDDSQHDALWTEGVTLVHNRELQPTSGKCTFSVATIAATKDPKTIAKRLVPAEAAKLEAKIRTVFNAALHHGCDALLLGALGCGAFDNPPEHVAEIFQAVVNDFRYMFRAIHFAVLAGKTNNFRVFDNVIH